MQHPTPTGHHPATNGVKMRHSLIMIAVVAFIAYFVWPNEHRPRGYRARRLRTRHTPDLHAADFILLRLQIQRNVAC